MAWRRGWRKVVADDGWGRLRSAVNPDLGYNLSWIVGYSAGDRFMLFDGTGNRIADGENLHDLLANYVAYRLNP